MSFELFFVAIVVNEKEHKNIKAKSNSVCGYYRNIACYYPINHPQCKTGNKYKIHSGGNVIHLFSLPGLPNLRSNGRSGKNSRG